MATAPMEKRVILAKSLELLEEVGSGGFGTVHRAKHKDWHCEVAVKILKSNVRSVLFEEAEFMKKASFEFVLKLIGIYEGPSGQRGFVTEYMKRGSMERLQKQLSGPPPWPLAFRFIKETALAMNFLHRQNIVHLDLKPSNILLSDELHVRLADFGLSMVSMSVVGSSKDGATGLRGTYPYIPPEAFLEDRKYKPVRAFDIYSFGILLWSILSGKEPYPPERNNDIPDMIPDGDRPGCRDNQAYLLNLNVDGMKEMVDLMRKCWDQDPKKRPAFIDILQKHETSLFLKHSRNINHAVFQVVEKLDSPNDVQQNQNPVSDTSPVMEVDQPSAGGDSRPRIERGVQQNDVVDHPQEAISASGDSRKTRTREEKAKFVQDFRDQLTQMVTNVPAIAETLGVGIGKTVHTETFNRILKKETDADKVRELYKTLNAGKRVQAAFYDALWIHESAVMEELGQ